MRVRLPFFFNYKASKGLIINISAYRPYTVVFLFSVRSTEGGGGGTASDPSLDPSQSCVS